MGDVFYCTDDKAFEVPADPKAEIKEYELTSFKFIVNDGNITFGKQGKLRDTVFDIDQPDIRTLKINGHYTNLIFAKDNDLVNLMLSSQEDSSLKLMYTIFGMEGSIMGLTATCDKF